MHSRSKLRLAITGTAFGVILLDRFSKAHAVARAGNILLPGGLIDLVCVRNTGMAFSLFSGRPWILAILSAALLTAGFFVMRKYRLGPLTAAACGLVLGGALSNLYDRIFQGYVVDMIRLTFIRFAVFNIADTFLVIGCVLLILSLFLRPDEWNEPNRKEQDA